MSLLNKLGIGIGGIREISRILPANGTSRLVKVPMAGAAASRTPERHESTRVSNGLKEFLWNLDGLGRGTLLDLGPAWQTTLNFFIERGFRVSSEDVLRGWKAFLDEDESRLAQDPSVRESVDMSPEGRAPRFLKT